LDLTDDESFARQREQTHVQYRTSANWQDSGAATTAGSHEFSTALLHSEKFPGSQLMDSPLASELVSTGLQDHSVIRNSSADNFANSLQLASLPSRDQRVAHEHLAYPCTSAFDSEFPASQPSTSPTPVNTEESQKSIVLTIENTSASARKAIVEIVMQDGGSVRLAVQ
jgi:hypothetical protein